MSKFSGVVLSSVIALGLSACVSEPTKPAVAAAPVTAPVAECTYGGTEIAAPLWICDGPVEGVEVSAVGIAEITPAGEGFAKQMAAADARLQLAQRMKVQVAGMIKQYAETTGAGRDVTVDQVNTAVTKQITNETLVGTRIFRSKSAPNGKMYVLLGLDPASVAKMTEVAVKTSMNNERAMWQRFQAGKSQDEMAAAIAAQQMPPSSAPAH